MRAPVHLNFWRKHFEIWMWQRFWTTTQRLPSLMPSKMTLGVPCRRTCILSSWWAAFLLDSGSASFIPKWRKAGSTGVPSFVQSYSISVVLHCKLMLSCCFVPSPHSLCICFVILNSQGTDELDSSQGALVIHWRTDADGCIEGYQPAGKYNLVFQTWH